MVVSILATDDYLRVCSDSMNGFAVQFIAAHHSSVASDEF
jgi:hypothetical protein